MKEKIKQVLDGILERFKSGDIPEAVAYSMYPMADDIPSAKWSLLNRILMFVAGTSDARGYKQWLSVNRYVKRGSKCFHILVPYIRKIEDEETGEEKETLVGFMSRPVFRYEDTDGEPLDSAELRILEVLLQLLQIDVPLGVSSLLIGAPRFLDELGLVRHRCLRSLPAQGQGQVATPNAPHDLIFKLANQGIGVVFVSSELPEVIKVSDRILVMAKGQLAGEFDHAKVTQEKIMAAATESMYCNAVNGS